MIKKLFEKYREIIVYIIFGGATTLVNWVTYTIYLFITNSNTEFNITAANSVSWAVAAVFSFIVNKIFVFRSSSFKKSVILREAAAFFGARVFSGLFEIFLPTLLFSIGLNQSFLSIEGFWAKLIVSILVIVLNYIFSKLVIFRKPKNK